jgi:hypothetical protein
MVAPPSGTLTFLFTDIQRSSRMWEKSPETMRTRIDYASHPSLRGLILRTRARLLDTEGAAWITEYTSRL